MVDDDPSGHTAEDQQRIDDWLNNDGATDPEDTLAWLEASEEELRFRDELRSVGDVTVTQEERGDLLDTYVEPVDL